MLILVVFRHGRSENCYQILKSDDVYCHTGPHKNITIFSMMSCSVVCVCVSLVRSSNGSYSTD